eukprot:scaffold55311_cov60-Cyclotella_meneghiniana.AAC.5
MPVVPAEEIDDCLVAKWGVGVIMNAILKSREKLLMSGVGKGARDDVRYVRPRPEIRFQDFSSVVCLFHTA